MNQKTQLIEMYEALATRYAKRYLETGEEFWIGMLQVLRKRIEEY